MHRAVPAFKASPIGCSRWFCKWPSLVSRAHSRVDSLVWAPSLLLYATCASGSCRAAAATKSTMGRADHDISTAVMVGLQRVVFMTTLPLAAPCNTLYHGSPQLNSAGCSTAAERSIATAYSRAVQTGGSGTRECNVSCEGPLPSPVANLYLPPCVGWACLGGHAWVVARTGLQTRSH